MTAVSITEGRCVLSNAEADTNPGFRGARGGHCDFTLPLWPPHKPGPPPPPLLARLAFLTVWQLLTGQKPFAEMRYAEVVYKVTIANIRPAFPSFTPPPLRQLAEECWRTDEAARPCFAAIQERLAGMMEDVEGMRCRARGGGGGDEVADPAAATTMHSPWIRHCNFEL